MKNKKLIKQSILISVIVFVVLIAVVLITNADAIKRMRGGKKAQETAVTQNDAEMESGQIGNDLSAFMQDSSFFEPKKNPSGITVTYGKKVSMIASSVAQDLRVMVVDQVGELCTGEEFTVSIEGQGEYTDEDKDGVVYLEHLRPGTYYVSLEPQDGFVIENTKLMIDVKEKISYVVMDDITYLVMTEDQIDVAKDDTRVNEASKDAEETEKTSTSDFVSLGAVGVDVSRYNQEIDWEKVAAEGIEYAIIRCGYRGSSSGSLVEDPLFRTNIEGAKKAGLKVGVYFFSQAITEREAVEEASMVEALCKYYTLDLPVYLDSESAGGAGRADALSTKERTDICKAFCKTIENAGHSAGVYASKNWLNTKLYADELEIYSIWMAQYSEEPTYQGSYQIWQYTSKGTVDGIPTKVDLNIRYR